MVVMETRRLEMLSNCLTVSAKESEIFCVLTKQVSLQVFAESMKHPIDILDLTIARFARKFETVSKPK